jgi:hypothetical protein
VTTEQMTAAELLAAYADGERYFRSVEAPAGDFTDAVLSDAVFVGGNFAGATFDEATIESSYFVVTRLAGASFREALVDSNTFDNCDLTGSSLVGAVLDDSVLRRCDLSRADLSGASLQGARLEWVELAAATAHKAMLGRTAFEETDVSPFCDAAFLHHGAPSYVEPRTVMRSYRHSGLKRFMVDCGIPPLFAEFMVDCARALDEPMLGNLMRSTFISYGGPDEAFARRLYDALREHGVVTFFFPETARVGERIDNEVYSRIQEHDRVILVCSRASLDRAGVLNEIQETFDREARDGGATYLLPIMLDDYVLTDWAMTQPTLAERVTRRVVGDFREAATDDREFDKQLGRLLAALKK